MLLITHFNLGGAQKQLYYLAVGLWERGWPVTVVGMLPHDAYMDDFARAGIPLHSLNMRAGIPDPRHRYAHPA
jgi:hypothetical protein